jgi:sugar lactone lactonase YvrE
MRRTLVLLLPALLLACSDPSSNTPPSGDASTDGVTTDASPDGMMGTGDATAEASLSDVPPADTSPPLDVPTTMRCGDERPPLNGTSGTEGIVIGPDGAIYFSQAGSVGRIAPDGTRNNRWAVIAGANTMWGLALDTARNRLYAGSPVTRKIHAVDLSSEPPMVSDFVSNAGAPNGLTMGPDGFLYYSDFTMGQVYRVDANGMRTVVTAMGIPSANGLAFDAEGNLLVLSYSQGRLYRLTLADGRETGRTMLATGLGSADGLALDAMGNLYVTDQRAGRLVRLSPTGGNPEDLLTGLNAPANIEFGYGTLRCTDIYIATGGGIRRFEEGMVAGAPVPWHR